MNFKRKQIFSIRKLAIGVVSLSLGTVVVNAVPMTNLGTVYAVSTTGEDTDTKEGITLQTVLTSKNNDGSIKTAYAVGEQVVANVFLNVSAPSRVEDGASVIVSLESQDGLQNVSFSTGPSGLPFEKISDNQYKVLTGAIEPGRALSFVVTYQAAEKFTASNSSVTIKADYYEANSDTVALTSSVSHTNTVTYPTVTGAADGTTRLVGVNPDDTIDASQSRDLKLVLENYQVNSATTAIKHEVVLPAGVVLAQQSIDEGWTMQDGKAVLVKDVPLNLYNKYEIIYSEQVPGYPATKKQNLYVSVVGAGTGAEFKQGKDLVFEDTTTYTDKSGVETTSAVNIPVTVFSRNLTDSVGKLGIYNNNVNGWQKRKQDTMPLTDTYDDWRAVAVVQHQDSKNDGIDSEVADIIFDMDGTNVGMRRVLAAEGMSGNNPTAVSDAAVTFDVYDVTDGANTLLGEVSIKNKTSITLEPTVKKVKLVPKEKLILSAQAIDRVDFKLHQSLTDLATVQANASSTAQRAVLTASAETTDGIVSALSQTDYIKDILILATNLYEPGTSVFPSVAAGNKTVTFNVATQIYAPDDAGGQGNQLYDIAKLSQVGMQEARWIVEVPDGFTPTPESMHSGAELVENFNGSGKTVLILPEETYNINASWPIGKAVQFNVAKWVPTGTYASRVTLVWKADPTRFKSVDPYNGMDFDNDGTTTSETAENTSSFAWTMPVESTVDSVVITKVDKGNGTDYAMAKYDLEANAPINYQFSLLNATRNEMANNTVLLTLPRKNDMLVSGLATRGSAFDVYMTGPAVAPAGWQAVYSVDTVGATASESAAKQFVPASAITDWSKVTMVKFISDAGTVVTANNAALFTLPAVVASDAQSDQKAYISAAAATNGSAIYNEGNAASVQIKHVSKSNVIVKYVDENGNPIKDALNVVTDGQVGVAYDTANNKDEKITAEGKVYKLDTTKLPDNASGTTVDGDIIVTYVYKEVKTSVTVKYVDEAGNAIQDPETVLSDASVGIDYDTTAKKQPTITTNDGRVYNFKEIKSDSATETGKTTETPTVVTYVYKEVTSKVVVNYVDQDGNEIKKPVTALTDLSIGSDYNTEDNKEEKITADNGKVYVLDTTKLPANAEGTTDGTDVTVTYVYNEVKTKVTVNYVDENGTEIKTPFVTEKSVGEKYDTTPNRDTKITTPDGKVYVLDTTKVPTNETGKTSETPTEVTYTYKEVKSSVIVNYVDENGNVIKTPVVTDTSVGVDYDTTLNKDAKITDKDGKVYTFKEIKSGSASETGKTSEIPTEVTYVYEEVKTKVIVNYVDGDGNVIKNPVVTDTSVGVDYDTTPNRDTKITTADGKVYVLDTTKVPTNETGKTSETPTEVIYTYKEVKSSVIVKYVDENGNEIKLPVDLVTNGSVGEKYDATAKREQRIEKDGKVYVLDTTKLPANQTGTLTEGVVEVIYVYKEEKPTSPGGDKDKPVKPVNPTNPINPGKPVKPTQPAEKPDTKQDESNKPQVEKGNTNKQATLPKTGQASTFVATLTGVAALVIGLGIATRRRKEQ